MSGFVKRILSPGRDRARATSKMSSAFDPFRDEVETLGTTGYSIIVNGSMLGPEHFETSYPDHWQERYERLNFVARDPILRFAFSNRKDGGDYRWSDCFNQKGDEGTFMRLARDAGLSYGGLFIRQFGSGVSFLSVARPDRELTNPEMNRLGDIATEYFALVTTEDLLSPKAVEVLQLLADGLSVAEAADHLSITENAAKNRLSEARKKTGVPNNNGLIGYARRRSLVQ